MPNQTDIFDIIRTELYNPRPAIVLFIGAGVSFGATAGASTASWRGLINSGLDKIAELKLWSSDAKKNTDIHETQRAVARSAFNAATFDSQKVLHIAHEIVEKLKPDYLEEWLFETIGSLSQECCNTDVLAVISAMQKLGVIIVTTNYDNLICDETGLMPTTWRESHSLGDVFNQAGADRVIHIHGHYSKPESLVFGIKSYEDITNSDVAQTVLKTLWLTHRWIFIGCGSGIYDPNIGKLIKWMSEKFNPNSERPHLFLGSHSEVARLKADYFFSKVITPYSYTEDDSNHSELPVLLSKLLPDISLFPLTKLDETSSSVRPSHLDSIESPFPSWSEFESGAVPELSPDKNIQAALANFQHVVVRGSPQTGKTTAIYKIAAKRPKSTSYYCDISDHNDWKEIYNSIQHHLSSDSLLVLDNCHHNPRTTELLFKKLKSNRNSPKVIYILNDSIEHTPLAHAHALETILADVENPPVIYKFTCNDLRKIAEFTINRVTDGGSRIRIPLDDLNRWHSIFKANLVSFVPAILASIENFYRGDYELDLHTAKRYFQKYFLDPLSKEEKENFYCIALFSGQDMELMVPVQILPFSEALDEIKEKGFVKSDRAGKSYSMQEMLKLTEPGWGKFIIEVLDRDGGEFYNLAVKDAALVRSIIRRFKNSNSDIRLDLIWNAIANNSQEFLDSIDDRALSVCHQLLSYARNSQRLDIIRLIIKHLDDSHSLDKKVPNALAHNLVGFIQEVTKCEQVVLHSDAEQEVHLSKKIFESIHNNIGAIAVKILKVQLSQIRVFALFLYESEKEEILSLFLKRLNEKKDYFVKNAVGGKGDISEISLFLKKTPTTHSQNITVESKLFNRPHYKVLQNHLWHYICNNLDDVVLLSTRGPAHAIAEFISLLVEKDLSIANKFVLMLSKVEEDLKCLIQTSEPDLWIKLHNVCEKIAPKNRIVIKNLYDDLLEKIETNSLFLLNFRSTGISNLLKFALEGKNIKFRDAILKNIDHCLEKGISIATTAPPNELRALAKELLSADRTDLSLTVTRSLLDNKANLIWEDSKNAEKERFFWKRDFKDIPEYSEILNLF